MKIGWHDFWEIVGCLAFCALVVVFFWLYLLATPDQLSGEADLFHQQLQERGLE